MIYLFLGLLLAAAAGFVALGLRTRTRYDLAADYRYPFAPDRRVSCQIKDGVLRGVDLGEFRDHSLLLALRLQGGRIRDPGVRLRAGGEERCQCFERGVAGLRFIDLSAFAGCSEALSITAVDCSCAEQAELLAFRNPSLEGNILIVAPHPDDAELAAFGLYSRHPERTTIVTVTAGESINDLARQYVPGLDDQLAVAARRKGLMRALDGVTAPRWGGVPPEAVIQLGYFNGLLADMERRAPEAVTHPVDPALRPALFRRFNSQPLASDGQGGNSWNELVADLAEILRRVRPATIVTTDPDLDPHSDHAATTRAVRAALALAGHQPGSLLYYVTHVRGTDEYPFGPPHCQAGPAPWFKGEGAARGYFSIALTPEAQRDKICAMEAMHDLRSTPRLEKALKRVAQAVVAGRRWPRYGEHGYFQTAVKANELFLVERRKG